MEKVVQIKFLAMHITNQKLSFDIFIVGNLYLQNISSKYIKIYVQNIVMEHDLY